MTDKEFSRRVAEICLFLCTAIIIALAIWPIRANSAVKTLKYGQCINVGRDRYCAPAKNVCPVQIPCPTNAPCPQTSPCPPVTNDSYWYAISSMFLACGSSGTAWNLSSADYVTKLSGLSLGTPTKELTISGCYVRYWDNAIVILNPQTSISCTVPFSGTYKDLETGVAISGSITVQPQKGKILTK